MAAGRPASVQPAAYHQPVDGNRLKDWLWAGAPVHDEQPAFLWATRLLAAVVLASAGLAAATAPTDEPLPAVALEHEWVLRAEVFGVVVIILGLVATVVARGLIQGRAPISISREGAEWPEEAAIGGEELLSAIRDVEERIAVIGEQAIATQEDLALHIVEVDERLQRLEAQGAGQPP
jgi:hypothetical protein